MAAGRFRPLAKTTAPLNPRRRLFEPPAEPARVRPGPEPNGRREYRDRCPVADQLDSPSTA